MINSSLEDDFWPWKWIHDGRECKTVQDYSIAWKSIDRTNDTKFSLEGSKHTNRRGDPFIREHSENIRCVHTEIESRDKISLVDYQDYAIKKFDQQMQKLMNKDNKFLVFLSGGIDSAMVYSWCVKHKVDIEVFIWGEDAWKGKINNLANANALSMCKSKGIKSHHIDISKTIFDNDCILKQYAEAELYPFPMHPFVTLGDGWAGTTPVDNPAWQDTFGQFEDMTRLIGYGTDDLFLHIESSWVRFIPNDILSFIRTQGISPKFMCNYGYHLGAAGGGGKTFMEKKDPATQQIIRNWDEMGLYSSFNQKALWPARSKEWFDMWHSIDEGSCTDEQFKDMVKIGWLKKIITQWTGSDYVDLIHSVPCIEKYFYLKNPNTKKFMLDEVQKFVDIYIKEKHPFETRYWTFWKRSIDYFDKIPFDVMEKIHTLNWMIKHGKN